MSSISAKGVCTAVFLLTVIGASIAGTVVGAQALHGQMSAAAFGTASITSGVFSMNLPMIIAGALAKSGTISMVLAAKITLGFSATVLGTTLLYGCKTCFGGVKQPLSVMT